MFDMRKRSGRVMASKADSGHCSFKYVGSSIGRAAVSKTVDVGSSPTLHAFVLSRAVASETAKIFRGSAAKAA